MVWAVAGLGCEVRVGAAGVGGVGEEGAGIGAVVGEDGRMGIWGLGLGVGDWVVVGAWFVWTAGVMGGVTGKGDAGAGREWPGSGTVESAIAGVSAVGMVKESVVGRGRAVSTRVAAGSWSGVMWLGTRSG